MRTRFWCVLLAFATILGCQTSDTQEMGQIRIVASVDANAATKLYVDDELLGEGSANEIVSQYFSVVAGEHRVDLSAGDLSVHNTILVESGKRYTIIPSLSESGQTAVLVDDAQPNAAKPQAETALSVRFVHSAAAQGPIDIFLTAPTDALDTAAPTAAALANGGVSPFTSVARGTYRLRIRNAGETSQVLFDSGSFQLNDTGKLSLVVLEQPAGAANAGDLHVLALTDTGSFPIDAFDPCTDAVADDDRASARSLSGMVMDGICSADDVDYYSFSIARDHLAVLELKTAALGSALTAGQISLWDSQGQPLSTVVQDAGADAALRILLFPGEIYYVSVSNAAGAGGAGYQYELQLTRSAAKPVTEATGGTFSGASNLATIAPFVGNFVAVSVRDEASAPVDYQVLVRVTLPTAARSQFVYDPTSVTDGVLRVVLYDGTVALPRGREGDPVTLSNHGLSALSWPGWQVASAFRASTQIVPFAATSGGLTVQFPARSVRRQIDSKKVLDVPTVTAATLNDARDTVSVTFDEPANASVYEASAFGRDSAFNGVTTGAQAPLDVVLDGALAEEEAYVVRTRAADNGLLSLPLPTKTVNVSEYLFYSDASAQ